MAAVVAGARASIESGAEAAGRRAGGMTARHDWLAPGQGRAPAPARRRPSRVELFHGECGAVTTTPGRFEAATPG